MRKITAFLMAVLLLVTAAPLPVRGAGAGIDDPLSSLLSGIGSGDTTAGNSKIDYSGSDFGEDGAGSRLFGSSDSPGWRDDRILDGIYAGRISLAGLTEEEASRTVEEYVDSLKTADVKLICVSGNTVIVKASALGLAWDNPEIISEAFALGQTGSIIRRYKDLTDLQKKSRVFDIRCSADHEKVLKILHEKCSAYNLAPVNAELVPDSGGSFSVIDGRDGQEVNVERSAEVIEDYAAHFLEPEDNVIDLVVDTVKPRGDAQTLSRIRDRLGTYTTSYPKSSSDRCANIAAGCGHINGTILFPGEQFSVYKAVSPFTEENGYHLAGSYQNGLVVESLGGGICQVSSTLYQAVLRSELQVDQRSNHSMVVDYVPHSGDAAIAGTSKDFKFTNNTENPIYIAGSTGGKQITFSIYGVETRPSNRTLEFESIDISSEQPSGEKVVGDSSQPAGYARTQSAHTGYHSEFWKIVKVDGAETSREKVNTSYYKAEPRILTLGTKTDSSVARAALSAAIATQSIEYGRAVAESVKKDGGAGALAAQQAAQSTAAAQAAATQAAAAQAAAAQPAPAAQEPKEEAKPEEKPKETRKEEQKSNKQESRPEAEEVHWANEDGG